ncbi:MAG TPA: hypothetical protein VFQ71_00450 [Gaiellales bacterium]|nr:hypothetical protein [Gaiellales bacterium]
MGALFTALFAMGLPGTVAAKTSNAICRITGAGNCAEAAAQRKPRPPAKPKKPKQGKRPKKPQKPKKAAPASATAAERAANQALAQKLAAERGWTGTEWDCLNNLWTNESHWDHLADNPTSSAYGIPQATGGRMQSAGADWRTNPETQIRWGLNYIATTKRYGTPCKAWAWWQRTDVRPTNKKGKPVKGAHGGHWY